MPNIKPISDLRNYNEILKDVDIDSPVFLTKNGRGCYVVLDIREYEAIEAKLKLLSELKKGENRGEMEGYLIAADVREKYVTKA